MPIAKFFNHAQRAGRATDYRAVQWRDTAFTGTQVVEQR